MQILHVVGNRPQFIKLAPLSRELHKQGYEDLILHTGQHYDENMSDIFFDELEISKPIKNLNVGSGTHAEITARVLMGVEKAVSEYQPQLVILYGDTDSTLGAALACRKLNIPIAHVEAGTRTFSKTNPEEINRIVTDHVSDICFCPDRPSVQNLKNEGIVENVCFSGDIMYDTFLWTKNNMTKKNILEKYGLEEKEYVLMTWHRQENTMEKVRMENILSLLEKIRYKILLPLHPRTKKCLIENNLWDRINNIENLILTDPVGYNEMVALQSRCRVILTDSGGLSKESCFAGVRCFFMIDLNVWPELYESGRIIHLYFSDKNDIEKAANQINGEETKTLAPVDFYGDGNAAAKIVSYLRERKFI